MDQIIIFFTQKSLEP